jgi:hypothetical protein
MTNFRNVYTALLLVIAGSTHRELASQVTYLKAENQILRRRLPDRIILSQREKNRLIRFVKNVGSLAFNVQDCRNMDDPASDSVCRVDKDVTPEMQDPVDRQRP